MGSEMCIRDRANIGQGAAMDRVAWFYEAATRMMGESSERKERRQRGWSDIGRAADQLPDL